MMYKAAKLIISGLVGIVIICIAVESRLAPTEVAPTEVAPTEVKVGQTWYFEIEEGNPFEEGYGICKVITDIKDGWVAYKIYDSRNPSRVGTGYMEIKDLSQYTLIKDK